MITPYRNAATTIQKIQTQVIQCRKENPVSLIPNGNFKSPCVVNVYHVYNVYNVYNVYQTPPSPISYGNFSFPDRCPPFISDGGHDCPQGSIHLTINGPQIGDSLLQAKKR